LHTHLGIIYYEKGDYDAALLHYLDGLALSEELGNKLLESIALGGTGCIYEVRGEYIKAKSYFEEDLKLAQSLGDRQGMAIAYGLLGGHFVLTGDFDTALRYLEPNLKLCEELVYRKGLIRSLNTLAEIAFYRGNYSEAIGYYQRSIVASGEIDNKLLQGIAMIDLCYIYLQTGEREKAAALHNELEEHRKIVTKKTFHFRYMLLSAALKNASDDKLAAEQILHRALQQEQLSAEEGAAVYDQLTAVYPASDELRQMAIAHYKELYEKTPKYLYKHRISKLTDVT
jgi:tetratricopeptide (TPR) repeat protein